MAKSKSTTIRCKLCRLQKQNKPLWKKVHQKLFEENIAQATVCAWLNEQVEVYNAGIENPKNKLPTFNDTNFSLHLSKHIPDREVLKRELIQEIIQKESLDKNFTEEEREEVKELAYIGLGEQSENYVRLSNFVGSFINKLTTYNDELNTNSTTLTPRDLTDLGNVLKSVIIAQKELTAIKNSDRLAGVAVRSAIESTLAAYVPLIVEALEGLRVSLQEELGVESSLARGLPHRLKEELLSKDVLQKLSADIVMKVFEDYKIK